MNLTDIIHRTPPAAWTEGDNIPWNEPGFSERMLKEHLSQEHDAASRRSETIERHVTWIYNRLLAGRPAKVLDLGCGPGLYASQLARKGCHVAGIDFSPASIRYARETARKEGLSCAYTEGDLRQAEFGRGYELAMFIYGEFNVFKPEDAKAILRKTHDALGEGGILLLELSPLASIREIGRTGSSWYTSPSGLFSFSPHLVLQESAWHEDVQTAATRYFVVDPATGDVTRHAASYKGYTKDQLAAMLNDCGFNELHFFPTMALEDLSAPDGEFIAITGKRL